MKGSNRSRKMQIRVFGLEYTYAYIGPAYAAQLYVYTYFEYAYIGPAYAAQLYVYTYFEYVYAYRKHVNAHTHPNPNLETTSTKQSRNKLLNLTT